MRSKLVYTVAALVAALSVTAVPAEAQNRRGEGRERTRERSAERGGGERAPIGRAVPRQSEGRQTSAAQQAPRPAQGPRYQAPQDGSRTSDARPYAGAPSVYGGGAAQRQSGAPNVYSRGTGRPQSGAPTVDAGGAPRPSSGSARGSSYYGGTGQRAVPRSYGYQAPAYRYDDRRGYARPGAGYGRYESRAYVRPRYYEPYRPYYFSRPYYGFRPHIHIGLGVWLGVSVPYPWAYFGTYRPRVYGSYGQGYYDRGYYGVAPGLQEYGGLSFDIQPSDADLFVDGEYVGPVGTFTPYGEPLTLWPGVHRIAIVRDGFRTLEFEVTVQPGQVIPYRGMLARW